MGIEYKIIKDYGTIADHNGVQLKLRLISWNGNPERLDLRAWRNDYARGGITMGKDELKKLGSFINELCLTHKTETVKNCSMNKTVIDICNEIDKKKVVTDDTTTEKKKAKSYKNAHEKFVDQFATYRKSQPDNRQKGYELTHNLILNHIKTICETSDEYNKNAMQEWKNSGDMMRFCQDKAFENADALMNVATKEEAMELMFQWVDEYIGNTDDQPKSKPQTKRGRKKKGA